MIEIEDPLGRQTPVLDELVPAQGAVDDQDRVAGDQRAVLLQHVLEERDFEAAAAVVEDEARAPAALSDLEHEAGDRDTAAGRCASRPSPAPTGRGPPRSAMRPLMMGRSSRSYSAIG